MADDHVHHDNADETAVHGTPAAQRAKSLKYVGAFVLGGAVLAFVIGFLSLTLARYGIIGKLSGFIGFMMMLNPLRALAVIGLLATIAGIAMKIRPVWQAALGTVLAVIGLAVLYFSVIIPGGNAPPLHDITTNVDDPPEFTTLSLREDNLIPFQNIEEWKAAHRQGYPDIGPIVIEKSPELVLADARALAEARGWDIANVDPASGHMEATAYAGYLRFMDDVIVEVTPIADGSTRVDMRSVSRVGLSDLGYNAKRIRAFLIDLQSQG